MDKYTLSIVINETMGRKVEFTNELFEKEFTIFYPFFSDLWLVKQKTMLEILGINFDPRPVKKHKAKT